MTVKVTIELTDDEVEVLRVTAEDARRVRPQAVTVRRGDVRLPLLRRVVTALPQSPVTPVASRENRYALYEPDEQLGAAPWASWRRSVRVVGLDDGHAFIVDADGDHEVVKVDNYRWLLLP